MNATHTICKVTCQCQDLKNKTKQCLMEIHSSVVTIEMKIKTTTRYHYLPIYPLKCPGSSKTSFLLGITNHFFSIYHNTLPIRPIFHCSSGISGTSFAIYPTKRNSGIYFTFFFSFSLKHDKI